MQLIKQPNRWPCTACAFAMVCDMTLEEFIEKVGHDGSEIVFPDLPEPLCRKGFPFPECIQVCLQFDLSVTPVDFKPRCGPDEDHWYKLDHTDFVNQMLSQYRGVISGMGSRNYHCAAWDSKRMYDPTTMRNAGCFKPEIFWIVK